MNCSMNFTDLLIIFQKYLHTCSGSKLKGRFQNNDVMLHHTLPVALQDGEEINSLHSQSLICEKSNFPRQQISKAHYTYYQILSGHLANFIKTELTRNEEQENCEEKISRFSVKNMED